MNTFAILFIGSYSALMVFFGGVLVGNVPASAVPSIAVEATAPAPFHAFPDVVLELDSADPLWVSAADEAE